MGTSPLVESLVLKQVHSLVEEYRDRCLWFLRRDYLPQSRDEVLKVLDLIERYGDRNAFTRAEEIRASLSQNTERHESYVAGGVALNTLLSGSRVSQDIDLFHDTQEALNASWTKDRKTLLEHGFQVDVVRESASFVEASVAKDRDQTTLQWARDSAYRFFPLILHTTVGLTMHPFDLATNKVLAMAGRLEVRDWIDVLSCDGELQPLGYLLWAACGKDPGYNPRSLLAAARRQHYSQAEINSGVRRSATRRGGPWEKVA